MVSFLDLYLRATRIRLNAAGFESRFLSFPEGRMHVFEHRGPSDGLPFLVIHGIGTSAATFSPLLWRLRTRAGMLWAPDLPGHGFSDIPARLPGPEQISALLSKALCQLIQEPVVLVGTSLGGGLALRFTLDHPHLVHRLVLCSPAGAPMAKAAFDALRASFRIQSDEDGRAYVDKIFHRSPWYRALAGREVRKLLQRPVVRHFLEQSTQGDLFSAREVAGLETPTLLIWGRSEKVLPPECLEWFRAHLPSSVRIDEPEKYGHSPHLEEADDLAARILEFVSHPNMPLP